MAPAHSPIPDIPGTLLTDPMIQGHLTDRVAELCGVRHNKFPGSQPVSFTSESLEMLERMDFWVCEKSDGVRVLVFIVMNGMSGNQEVWLIDRKQRYFSVTDLHFPHWERRDDPLTDTILDGELVVDIDSKTGVETLRFYAFDCLVLHGENIMQKTLLSRFGRLKSWVVAPFDKALKDIPEWKELLPFEVLAKEQLKSYYISQVLEVQVPQLQHGHDGLIFTCVESSYVPGTDEKILKWKPPSENSIDFKAELRFPPLPNDPSEPDFYAKPTILLNTWLGGQDHEFFDEMEVDDDEWEKMKESGEQLDDRVIEVCWDTSRGRWRMMRIRDDKPNANHKSIMEKILVSIDDGVEIEALLAHSEAIKTAWKAREAAKAGGAKPPPPPQPKRQPSTSMAATPGPMPPTPGAMGGQGAGFSAPNPPRVMAGLKR